MHDALMRLPLAALAGWFLVRECQSLQAAEGTLRITAHVATLLFRRLAPALRAPSASTGRAARRVTTGLYAGVRPPLYLAEAIASLGIFLLYRSAEAAVLVVLQFAIQLRRMQEEEKVLQAAFPDYEAYRKRTARLIPGLY
jgi:protein-S-isoprenylcysteine O-methyltransferase Ste14